MGYGGKDIPSTFWYSPCRAEERDGGGKLEGGLLTGDFIMVFLVGMTAGQARPEPPPLPGLDAGKTDLELFKDCMVIFYFDFCYVFLERGNRLVHGRCLG